MPTTSCDLMILGQSSSYDHQPYVLRSCWGEAGLVRDLDILRTQSDSKRKNLEALVYYLRSQKDKGIFKRMKDTNKFTRHLNFEANKKKHT